jgi:O-antigen/teichoic acid export membrane protein
VAGRLILAGRTARRTVWRVVTRAQLRGRLAGIAPVGGGLALVGLAAYVVLALAGHTLNPRDYAAAASMFLLTAIVGPGVFAAVEQQTNHEVSARLAAGVDPAPSVRAAAVVAAGLALLMSLVVLALAPVLVPRAFAGHTALLAATVLAVLGAAAAYLLRGIFAGQRRFQWYGISLAGEGLGRLLPCAALALFGWATADRFGFVFALGCAVAAAVTLPALRRGIGAGTDSARRDAAARDAAAQHTASAAGAPVRLPRLAASVGLLACASSLTLLVVNLGPVVLTSRLGTAHGDAELAASFVSLFLLARIPLFLFAPVQAFLLPALTAAAERGDLALVRRQVRTALLAVTAVGGPGVLAAGLLGPWASRVLFSAPLELSRGIAALLGVSTVAMMAAQILQPALVALGRNRAAMLSWVVSSALFVGLLFAPVAPLGAAVTAQLVAPALVCLLMGLTLRRELRGRAAGTTAPDASAAPDDSAQPETPGQTIEPSVTNSL